MNLLLAASQGGANGIEAYTRRLASGLTAHGHRAVIAERHQDAAFPLPRTFWPLRRIWGPLESWRTHGDLRAALQCQEFHVVHATYCEFVPRSTPSVATAWHPSTSIHDRLRMMAVRGERGVRGSALFAFTDLVAHRRASAVVAITREVQQALHHVGVASEWISPFIHDHEVSRPLREREATCVMVARWVDEPRKGLALALEAVEHARRARRRLRLVLVGGFRDAEQSRRLPGFCRHLGVLDGAATPNLLGTAGCCLRPSRWEEFGYAGVEALAAGTPLVTSVLPAFDGIQSDGLRVVDSQDAMAWSSAILDALAVDDFEFPTEFRASACVPRLIELYTDVAAHGRAVR